MLLTANHTKVGKLHLSPLWNSAWAKNLAHPTPLQIINNQWRVIGKALLFVDAGGASALGDFWRGNLIVDAPTHILRPRLSAIRPPCIGFQLRMDFSEHIDPTDFIKKLCQPSPFFGQKS